MHQLHDNTPNPRDWKTLLPQKQAGTLGGLGHSGELLARKIDPTIEPWLQTVRISATDIVVQRLYLTQ